MKTGGEGRDEEEEREGGSWRRGGRDGGRERVKGKGGGLISGV